MTAKPTPSALAVSVATTIGALLAHTATTQDHDDAAEITAITDAMVRLLVGVPLRSDGQLTIKTLATEAGLKRNKLTHKHTGLKDLFYALVRAQNHRPHLVDGLHRANDELRDRLTRLTAERNQLKTINTRFAHIVQVLELENRQLREDLEHDTNVRVLRSPSRGDAETPVQPPLVSIRIDNTSEITGNTPPPVIYPRIDCRKFGCQRTARPNKPPIKARKG